MRTGRGSPCVRGGVCFHMSVEMVSDHRPVCICGCASSCGGTGGTDAARPCGRGLGLVSPCLTATFSSQTSMRPSGPLAHPSALAWQASARRGWVWRCLLWGLPFWVGPAVGRSLLGKELLHSGLGHSETSALLSSAPHSLKGLFAGAGMSSVSPPHYLVTFVCVLVSPP